MSAGLIYHGHSDKTALTLFGATPDGSTLVIEKLSFSMRAEYDDGALDMVESVATDATGLTITASGIGKDGLDAETTIVQSVVDEVASKTQVLRLTLPNSSFDNAEDGYSVTVTLNGIETTMDIGRGDQFDIDLDQMADDDGYPADFGAEYITQKLVERLIEVHVGVPGAVVGSIERGYVSGPSAFTASTDAYDAGFVIEFTAVRPGRDLMGAIGSPRLTAEFVTEGTQLTSYDVVRPGLLVWKPEEKSGVGSDSGTAGLSEGTDEKRVNSGDTGASDHGLSVSTTKAGADADPKKQDWTNPDSGYEGNAATQGDDDFFGDSPQEGNDGDTGELLGLGQDYLNPGGGRVDGADVDGVGAPGQPADRHGAGRAGALAGARGSFRCARGSLGRAGPRL